MKDYLLSSAALILGAAFSTTTAHAQYRYTPPDAGWYWRVDAGATIPQDGHITQFGPWNAGQKISYDVGGAVDVGFGYLFNRYIAAEGEVGGTWSGISSIENASIHNTTLGTAPILANLVLQYPIPQTRLVPYIGAGVGGAGTFFDTDSYYRQTPNGAVSLHGSDSDFVFAWQGLAGLRLALNSRMMVGVSYRYLHVDPSSYSYGSYYYGGPTLNLGLSSQDSHIVGLSFVMKF
jgi:opacity protein-like surface antigen